MKRMIILTCLLTLLTTSGCQLLEGSNLFKKNQPSREINPNQQSAETNNDSTNNLRMIMVGDILLASTVEKLMDANGVDYPWLKVQDLLQEADLAIGNLETSVAVSGQPLIKQYTFQARPDSLVGAQAAGMDVLTTANNHTLDFGPEALLETIENLKHYDLKTAGAGENEHAAFQPAQIQAKGRRIAVLAASRVIPTPDWRAEKQRPGLATTYDPSLLLEAITAAKQENDLVVVSVHWGKELALYPEDYQIDLAHQYIDAGADVVLGHHPHVLQGLEIYKGKVIAYSLGNFIFSSRSEITRDSALLMVEQDPDGGLTPTIIPAYITAGQPNPQDPTTDPNGILAKLRALSEPFNTIIDTQGILQERIIHS